MSSFLEDFLKKEVDQNQVNALVGSLENQLTTSRSSPVAVPGSLNATPGKNTINSNQHYVNVTSNLRAGTPENSLKNSPVNSIRNKIVASIVHTVANGSIEGRKLLTVASNGIDGAKSASPGPISGSSGSPRMANINNTIQVSIAPKVSNTVPIAPRLGSNIMISPRHAQQIFMAQQRFSQNALFQNAFITRVPGGIPVVPRMPGAIAVPSIINAQIPNVRTVGQARQQGIINMVPRSNGPTRVRVNSPLSAASLTQIKTTTNAIPGQVNYRFRQVNPASVNQNNGVSSSPAAANLTVMKESVKRLKEFFQNLINLACGPNQPPEIGRIVKELVHNLMQSRISEEEFIDKLQKTLKSDPQPNLVHFLKKTLPHLRETIKKQQIHQTNSKNVQQISKANSVHHNIRGIAPSILVGDSHKAFAGQGRIIVASSGQVTPGMKTRLQAPHHGMAGKVFVKPNGTLSDAAMGNARKDKSRSSNFSTTGADEEYIDVTSMAGVNLMEESQKILATGSDLMSFQTRSVDEKPFLLIEHVKPKIDEIVKRYGISDVHSDVLKIISHATEQRLRSLVERLSACCFHRNDPHKDEVKYETTSFVRNQLKVFDEIDEVERKHRESREREMLMRVAKSRSRAEDPEQARLKEKAKQMQLEEEEMNRKRAANKTALEAIGGPRKKRKLDEALESLQNSQTSNQTNRNSNAANSSLPNSSQQSRSRQHRRITLKDVQFVLESERNTSKSLMLYKSYLR